MSKNSLILVLQNKQENSTVAMAKIHIMNADFIIDPALHW